jgi:hypothetical protein
VNPDVVPRKLVGRLASGLTTAVGRPAGCPDRPVDISYSGQLRAATRIGQLARSLLRADGSALRCQGEVERNDPAPLGLRDAVRYIDDQLGDATSGWPLQITRGLPGTLPIGLHVSFGTEVLVQRGDDRVAVAVRVDLVGQVGAVQVDRQPLGDAEQDRLAAIELGLDPLGAPAASRVAITNACTVSGPPRGRRLCR